MTTPRQAQRRAQQAQGRNRYGRPRRTHWLTSDETAACGRPATDQAVAGYVVDDPASATCGGCQLALVSSP